MERYVILQGYKDDFPVGVTETFIIPEDEFNEFFDIITVEPASSSARVVRTRQMAKVKKVDYSIDIDLFHRRFTMLGVFSVVPIGDTPYMVVGTYQLADDWDANI